MQGSPVARRRFGLVGTGFWARVVHGAGLAAHPGVELVGVWGRDRGKAEEVAGPLDARAYADFEEMLPDVDAVALAVPPHVQAGLALKAAGAGKHLLLEKPIALDLAVADRLVAAVEQRGLRSLVFFTQRFVPLWETWLDGARSAPLLGGRATWLETNRNPGNPFAGSAWRREAGALWDVGPHALASLLPALGPVRGVAGGRGAEDLVHLVLTHDSGATSVMSLSQRMPVSTSHFDLELYGEQGWLTRPATSLDIADAYRRAVTELLADIDGGSDRHRCDVRFGRDVVEVLARCEEFLGPR